MQKYRTRSFEALLNYDRRDPARFGERITVIMALRSVGTVPPGRIICFFLIWALTDYRSTVRRTYSITHLVDQGFLGIRTCPHIPPGERIQCPRGQRRRKIGCLFWARIVTLGAEVMDGHRFRHLGLDNTRCIPEHPRALIVAKVDDRVGDVEKGHRRPQVHGVERSGLRTRARVAVDDAAGTTGHLARLD